MACSQVKGASDSALRGETWERAAIPRIKAKQYLKGVMKTFLNGIGTAIEF
jgi:hypothetical protein